MKVLQSQTKSLASSGTKHVTAFIRDNPIASITGGAAVLGVSALATSTIIKKARKKGKTKRGRSRDRKFISKQKHEKSYIKRKKKAGKKITRKRYKSRKAATGRKRKIYYAKKTGQPYIKLKSGKAKFIKGKRRKTR